MKFILSTSIEPRGFSNVFIWKIFVDNVVDKPEIIQGRENSIKECEQMIKCFIPFAKIKIKRWEEQEFEKAPISRLG